MLVCDEYFCHFLLLFPLRIDWYGTCHDRQPWGWTPEPARIPEKNETDQMLDWVVYWTRTSCPSWSLCLSQPGKFSQRVAEFPRPPGDVLTNGLGWLAPTSHPFSFVACALHWVSGCYSRVQLALGMVSFHYTYLAQAATPSIVAFVDQRWQTDSEVFLPMSWIYIKQYDNEQFSFGIYPATEATALCSAQPA